jgi:hypothetical protein
LRPAHPRRWTPPPSTEICSAVVAVENLCQVRVRLDPLRVPLSDSIHGWIASILATDCNACSTNKFRRLDLSKDFRFKFPPNASRTDRFEIFGVTDLAPGHCTSTSRCHLVVRIGETESKVSVKP